MLNVIVNGEARDIEMGLTLYQLVQDLLLDPTKVAVELNLEIIPKPHYQQTELKEGDKLEIVHFIGGGCF